MLGFQRGIRGVDLSGVSPFVLRTFPPLTGKPKVTSALPLRASPAHIASLVRAPLRFAKGAELYSLALTKAIRSASSWSER